ncbi:hypothetical protein FOA52_005469, partial [Chlamydomonas sp. UWO 241]
VGGAAARARHCTLYAVDPQLLETRPGLVIHQACWHAHSHMHCALLTSDGWWRLYGVDDLSLAEQAFCLNSCIAAEAAALHAPPPPAAGTAITPGGFSASTPAWQTPVSAAHAHAAATPGAGRFGLLRGGKRHAGVTSFAWGPPVGWGFFSVLFASSGGGVFALCPVCPFGMRVPASVLRRALSSSEAFPSAAVSRGFLNAAFGVEAVSERFEGRSVWLAQRHAHDGYCACLQGPLNLPAQVGSSPTLALHCAYLLDVPGDVMGRGAQVPLPGASCTSCIVTATCDGRLSLHVAHGLLGPCWQEGTPQCVLDTRGDTRAVRNDCPTLPLSQSPASSWGGMLLLDVVDLQLPSSGNYDEEEDDEGAGGDASARTALAPGAGTQRLRLLGGRGAPHSLWAVHASGAWQLTVTWLPLAARLLASPAPAGVDGVGGVDAVWLDADTLPPPLVAQLAPPPTSSSAPPPRITAGCALCDLFVGESLLLMSSCEDGGSSGAAAVASPADAPLLMCFRQRAERSQQAKAAALDAAAADAGAAAAAGTGTSSPAGQASPPVKTPRQQQLSDSLHAIYDDILSGFKPVKLPEATGPTGSQDPEGGVHLHACIGALRGSHVEFIHRADAELRTRMATLSKEASLHKDALSELSQLHTSVASREVELAERAGRVALMQANLQARSDLLARLHWSLPRPASSDEAQLSEDLSRYSRERTEMATAWAGLRRRLAQALGPPTQGGARGGGRPAALAALAAAAPERPSSLPDGQAVHVHGSIMEQFRLITLSMQELKGMQADVLAWKATSEGEVAGVAG